MVTRISGSPTPAPRSPQGERATYLNFGAGEPDNADELFPQLPAPCVVQRVDGTWMDTGCANTRRITCERESVPCGDGVTNADEQCDDGNDLDDDDCHDDCTLRCGDGVVDADEQCDDGNFFDEDRCTSLCVIGALCPRRPGMSEFVVVPETGICDIASAEPVVGTEIEAFCAAQGGTFVDEDVWLSLITLAAPGFNQVAAVPQWIAKDGDVCVSFDEGFQRNAGPCTNERVLPCAIPPTSTACPGFVDDVTGRCFFIATREVREFVGAVDRCADVGAELALRRRTERRQRQCLCRAARGRLVGPAVLRPVRGRLHV